jgi:hypothetical protein
MVRRSSSVMPQSRAAGGWRLADDARAGLVGEADVIQRIPPYATS